MAHWGDVTGIRSGANRRSLTPPNFQRKLMPPNQTQFCMPDHFQFGVLLGHSLNDKTVARKRSASRSFPAELAKQTCKGWAHLVAGDYSPPPLPNQSQLRELLEIAYLAGMETDESRPLRFMLCCTKNSSPITRLGDRNTVESWEVTPSRPFNIQEIRRLAAVTDLDASAIWVSFTNDPSNKLEIRGLVNLGRSWSVARNAFAYHYDHLPHALLVRVIAPGRMAIYQGSYRMATLAGGQLEVGAMRMAMLDLLGVDRLLKETLNKGHF